MSDAINNIIEAHKQLVIDFIEWTEKHWSLEPIEKWPHAEPVPTEEFRSGYQAAIEGLKGAFECFFEEFYT